MPIISRRTLSRAHTFLSRVSQFPNKSGKPKPIACVPHSATPEGRTTCPSPVPKLGIAGLGEARFCCLGSV